MRSPDHGEECNNIAVVKRQLPKDENPETDPSSPQVRHVGRIRDAGLLTHLWAVEGEGSWGTIEVSSS
jgi:hypothetical protein